VRLTLRWLWLAAVAPGGAGVASAQLAPVPPPAEQQTADCSAPVFATDQLVCSDPALRALDTELAGLLADAPERSSRWIEPQSQWFLRRSRCAFAEDHSACAMFAYRERLALMRSQGSEAKMLKANCNDLHIRTIAVEGDWIILIDREGRIAGIAGGNDANNSWRPFLSATWRSPYVFIKTQEGSSLKCEISSM